MIVGVIGCGSIGRRHIKNLSIIKKPFIDKIVAFDTDKKNITKLVSNNKIEVSNNFRKTIKICDSVIIATPNHLHARMAYQAVLNNCNVLVEKPFSHNLKKINQIINISKKNKLIITTGYMLRFYKPLLKLKQILNEKIIGKIFFSNITCGNYLPDWRPNYDYTKNYGAHKRQGGGVILDAIHEINYSRWLFGEVSKVFCTSSKLSKLKIDTEDYASINLIMKNNIHVHLNLDYLQQNYNRNCIIVGEKGTIYWDFNHHEVKIFLKKNKKWKTLYKINNINFNDTYLNELRNFLRATIGQEKQVVNFDEGKKDLLIALAAHKSSKSKKIIKL